MGSLMTFFAKGSETSRRFAFMLYHTKLGNKPQPHVHEWADDLPFVREGTMRFYWEERGLAVDALFRCHRPGVHRRANYLLQLLPARAAGRKDCHSVNDCSQKAGQRRWIAIFRQVVL